MRDRGVFLSSFFEKPQAGFLTLFLEACACCEMGFRAKTPQTLQLSSDTDFYH